jgi:hypothetical protein
LNWTTTESPVGGFKILWGRKANPAYPRPYDDYKVVEGTARTATIQLNRFNQELHFRICVVHGFACDPYSNDLAVKPLPRRGIPTPTFIIKPTLVTVPETPIIADTGIVTSSIPGDANNDSKVDGKDYLIWRKHLGQNVTPKTNGDFDGNGIVDGSDKSILMKELYKQLNNHK